MMKRCVFIIAVFCLAPHAFSQTGGKEYSDSHDNKIFLPLGDLSFADEVVAYEAGSPKPVHSARDSSRALGPPTYNDLDTGFVTLGCGGVLTLKFTDNSLVDIHGPDLFVFEVGKYIEKTNLKISRDGKTWIDAGEISGGTAQVDIRGACKPGEAFSYVRLTDLRGECSGQWPGADIDAVAAIGSGKNVSLKASLLFDFNKYELKGVAEKKLDSIIAEIKRYGNPQVIIEGHTDSIGNSRYNQKLSELRAMQVALYMKAKLKFKYSPRTFGYGCRYPVADNKTDEGREQNRRVLIIIVPQHPPGNNR
jgi:outer membrane protein OmpA-like peptidoglycan-associated protein